MCSHPHVDAFPGLTRVDICELTGPGGGSLMHPEDVKYTCEPMKPGRATHHPEGAGLAGLAALTCSAVFGGSPQLQLDAVVKLLLQRRYCITVYCMQR